MALNIGNINFKNSNELIRMMMPYLMRYNLGNIDQRQRLETISEQDRLMRERSAIDAVEAQRNATEKHRLTIDEIFTRANAELSKEPGYTYLQGKVRLARQQGNKADEELYATQMAETMTPYIQALYKQTTGRDLTEKDIAATLTGGGVGGAEKGISEYGTSKRFQEELPIKKITAETGAGHLKFAREQFEEEKMGGKFAIWNKEYYNAVHAKIENAKKYILQSAGKTIDPMTAAVMILNPAMKTILGTEKGKALSEKTIAKVFTELNRVDWKAMKEELSPEEVNWMTNLPDMEGLEVEGGAIPTIPKAASTIPATDVMSVETPTTAPIATPVQGAIPTEVQAYMLKHPELSLDYVMGEYRKYLSLKGQR